MSFPWLQNMKLLVLILLLNYASAEAEAEAEANAEAEADPHHRTAAYGQVKKPAVKIANPKLIHTSHVIQNQKGAFQVWLVKGQAKGTAEGKHQRSIVKTRTDTLARIKQQKIQEVERSSSSISNSLDSLSAPSQTFSQHHPPPGSGLLPLAATHIFHFQSIIPCYFRS